MQINPAENRQELICYRLTSSLTPVVLLLFLLPRDSVSALRKSFSCLFASSTASNILHSAPKAQPKSAATTKGAGATAGGRGRNKKPRGGKSARPAKKTAEELDSEMVDYWNTGATATETDAAATGGAAQPAANGDAPMEDEILVGQPV
jgi:hypothetical protein